MQEGLRSLNPSPCLMRLRNAAHATKCWGCNILSPQPEDLQQYVHCCNGYDRKGNTNIVYGTLSIKEDAATENHVTNASMNEGSLKPDLTRNSEKSLKMPEALRLNITINIPTMNKKESQSNSKSISLISCLPIYSAIAPTANPTIPTFIPNSGAIAKAGTPNANRAEAPLVTYFFSVSISTFL